ncbi:HTH-type transcriptional regulator MalT [compost metagenome]
MLQPLSTVGQDASNPAINRSTATLPRTALLGQLAEGAQRLTLLCAPAGYGKTTLLREHRRRVQPEQQHAWIDFSGQALTLAQFCQQVAAQLGIDPAQAGDGPALLRVLESLDRPAWLFLDDYPADADAGLDAWINHLLVRSDAPVELRVSSRQRPAWNLPRLLMQDQLLELGPDALAFSRAEFDALVASCASSTSDSGAGDIWQQTLGWCAGARLLLSARQRSTHAASHWLRDYLKHDVLSRLGDDQRRILAGLAHLPRFSADLCAQLWDDLDGRAVFHGLLQSQSFFQTLDQNGEWYRMLPAVANAMRCDGAGPEIGRLRLIACRVFDGLGFIDEAIEVALNAGHADVAVNYMERLQPNWLFAGRHVQTLFGWRQQLPLELLESTPNLIFLNASALLIGGRLDETQASLARLGHFLPQPTAELNRRLLAKWQALNGSLQSFLGRYDIGREYCQSALENLGSEDWHITFLGFAALARMATTDGDTLQAQQYLLEAVELARRQGCLASEVLINSERIGQMILCDETELARQLLDESLQLLAADGNRHRLMLGRLLVMRGKLHLKAGELDAAENALREALWHGQEHVGPFILLALTTLAEVSASRGDFHKAFQHLQDAERRMQCANVKEELYRGVINLRSLNLLARQGDWDQMLASGRLLEDYLRGTNARSNAVNSPSLPQRNQLLMALAEQRIGRVKEAERRLQTLEKDCQRLNYHRLWHETRQLLGELGENQAGLPSPSRQPAEPQPRKPFSLPLGAARPIRPASPHEGRRPLGVLRKGEELTSRELSILELMAEGLSNPEISERLYISTNTVKAHTKNINSKLGVVRRTQAIVRARAPGVLA